MQSSEQAAHYDQVWSIGHVWSPALWPDWKLIAPLIPQSPHRLEIGAGLRPRLPIAGTSFVDVSRTALCKLQAHGGVGIEASASDLPFADRRFDLIAACELLEHLADDQQVLTELVRILRPGGHLLLSVPLQPGLWTDHDILAGHFRRYAPVVLADLLTTSGFTVIAFSPQIGEGYSGLKKLGAWLLKRSPNFAIWLEDRITLPLGVRFQRVTRPIVSGFPLDTDAPGGFLLCQRSDDSAVNVS